MQSDLQNGKERTGCCYDGGLWQKCFFFGGWKQMMAYEIHAEILLIQTVEHVEESANLRNLKVRKKRYNVSLTIFFLV